ncbi:hypothetical protein EDB81DRAFT_765346 [Dactylonectria macrodidyma]|uniref:Uncharacterized protein n=1 Tax=Dactylonectria macrodidyma TaxID=307937 RepID=A0A9P9DSF3_9HYPO|nr:hypothetical protein EDB81DRAFT_765346 [Dactylonectria macrodidyma]
MDIGTGNSSVTSLPSQPEPVNGINVFWILFTLCVACSIHPVGSSIGFATEHRRYVRILPLSAFIDTFYLFAECIQLARRQELSFPAAAFAVARQRLQETISPESKLVEALILILTLDIRVRLLSNALLVFVYTKVWGYHGIPVSFTIATFYFSAWIGMEMVVLTSLSFVYMRGSDSAVALHINVTASQRQHLREWPKLLNLGLLWAQVLALILAAIWICSTSSTPAPRSDGPPTIIFDWHTAIPAIPGTVGILNFFPFPVEPPPILVPVCVFAFLTLACIMIFILMILFLPY